jgi:hypothetical protein
MNRAIFPRRLHDLYTPLCSQHTCLEFRDGEPEKIPEYSGKHYMVEEKCSVLDKLTEWCQNPTMNTKSATGHDLETLPTPLILTIHLPESQLNTVLQSRYLRDILKTVYELPNITLTCPSHPSLPLSQEYQMTYTYLALL